MTTLVSVVIATHERPQLLGRCVQALLRQQLPATAYEIVVVDDGSSEATRRATMHLLAEAAPASGGPVVRYLQQSQNRGPAAARNVGWQSAAGPVVAFTDDDTVPEPDWLREGLRALTPDLDAVAGRIEVPLPPQPTDYERDAAGLSRAAFATANCFVRRSVLASIGGFDERFRTAWREDTDLCFGVRARGGKVGMAERARVLHPVRPAGWGVSLAQQRKVMFDALLYKKYPAWYRREVRPRPPLHYYAMVAGGLVAVLAVVTGQVVAAALGVAIWIGLATRFAARRLAGTSRAPRHVAEMLWTSLWIPWLSVYWRVRGALRYRVWFV